MSDSTQSKLTTLIAQRQSIVDELKRLTAERAKARLSAGEFSGGGRIEELNREVQEIDETIVLAKQMVSDEEDREIAIGQAESIDRQILELEGLRDAYLEQMQRLESASNELAVALFDIRQTMAKLQSIGSAVSGERDMPDFNQPNYETRLLARISECVFTKLGEQSRISYVLANYRLSPIDYGKLLPAWADEEARRFSNVLGKPIFKARKRSEQLRAAAAAIGADA